MESERRVYNDAPKRRYGGGRSPRSVLMALVLFSLGETLGSGVDETAARCFQQASQLNSTTPKTLELPFLQCSSQTLF